MNSETGNYGFFFGAGVERCYGLPSGADFTFDTMCSKNEDLYDALKGFYKELPRKTDSWENVNYRKEFVFRDSSSYAFQELIFRAAKKCEEEKDDKFDDVEKQLIGMIMNYDDLEKFKKSIKDNQKIKEDFSDLIGKLYDDIIKSGTAKEKKQHQRIMKNLSYYGTIEQDFATIINPKEAGICKFWRLINYFWRAYFSILYPIISKAKWETFSNVKNSYEAILKELPYIVDEIYSEDFLENGLYVENNQKDYYKVFQDKFRADYIFTTNYTPCIHRFTKEDGKIAFLAGELRLFEFPESLSVKNICGNEITDFCFPFLMTQAPVKPMISSIQLREYKKALEFLEKINLLIVVGYSFDNSDLHINAMIRDFLCIPNNRMIYCYYRENEESKLDVKEILKRQLRGDFSNQITIIENFGDAEELSNRLKEVLALQREA